jgi:hypothetical protein
MHSSQMTSKNLKNANQSSEEGGSEQENIDNHIGSGQLTELN